MAKEGKCVTSIGKASFYASCEIKKTINTIFLSIGAGKSILPLIWERYPSGSGTAATEYAGSNPVLFHQPKGQ